MTGSGTLLLFTSGPLNVGFLTLPATARPPAKHLWQRDFGRAQMPVPAGKGEANRYRTLAQLGGSLASAALYAS